METALRFFSTLAAAMLLTWAAVDPLCADDLKLYKDLHNEFIQVTNVQETEKVEEKYIEVAGHLELQKVPRKELKITARIVRKPPSTMDNVFGDPQAEPFFKVCVTFYDAQDNPGDEECQAIRFHRPVEGDIGALGIPYPPGAARYALRLIKRVDSTSSPFKLWVPTTN
ncbi:hypothetical protein G3N56_08350 [Desulfovibrio sulfodismutans]|uniref:DUF3426 domain-containing protein n=1 Tax=Desulfolutivibrio sulfodismutans TaxID=63561 RepID=A0A7K3NKM5_9BACT|nr:hypothetical protein [Desulfolutivibrio sulfodismutans]NDY56754.1 hypothetical protein [Desulfolutivibrio sulfodismutans]QLA13298.1 hypothetical protein GD606_14020 [Desulfolutivibrio sulfodismutans DSM 3696]